MDELKQLAKLEQDYQTQRTALLEAAKEQWLDQINPLIEIGKTLGFNYGSLDDKPSATPAARTATSSTGNRKQMSETDILEAQKDMLAYLKGKKGDQQSATEVFNGLGYEQSRHQTMQKHLTALLASGHIEATVKDTSKGKSPKNPTAYLWVKDLDN